MEMHCRWLRGDAQVAQKREWEACKSQRHPACGQQRGSTVLPETWTRKVLNLGECIAGGGEVMRKWLRRVSGEHASLSASLPVAWTSSVFLAADPSRLDVLRYPTCAPHQQ